MLSPEKKAIFDQFSKCEMGYHRAVRKGKFENYSVFLDEYYAAGYKYPIPNEDVLQKDAQAFDSFIKAATEYDKRCDAGEAEDGQRYQVQRPAKRPEAPEGNVGADNRHYAYRVIWSEEDQEYVGLCDEFPALSWETDDPVEALQGIVLLVKLAVKGMEDSGKNIPVPLALQKFSGEFLVNTTPETHRLFAERAEEAGVSFNQFITSRLTEQM